MPYSCSFNNMLLCCLGISLFGCSSWHHGFLKKDASGYELSARVEKGVLDNGFTYYVLNHGQNQGRCSLRLNVAVGSFSEADDELGMAHMVEHLAFADRAISKDKHLVEWLQEQGMAFGPDVNAATSAEHTVYKLDLPLCDEHALYQGLLVLKSFSNDLTFHDDDLSREKKIVDAEEAQRTSSQGQTNKKLFENLYAGSSYVLRPVIGISSVRDTFTKERIEQFYHRWYQPKNMALVVVGDFADLKPLQLIRELFNEIKPRAGYMKALPIINPTHKKPVFIVADETSSHVNVSLVIQAKKITKPVWDRSLLKERMALNMAIYMLNNALHDAAKNKVSWLSEPTLDAYVVAPSVYELNLNVAALKETMDEAFIEAYRYIAQALVTGFNDADVEQARAIVLDRINQEVIGDATKDASLWAETLVGYHQGKSPAFDVASYQQHAVPVIAHITADDCQKSLKRALSSGNQYFFATGNLEDTADNIKALSSLLGRAAGQKVQKIAPKTAREFAYHMPNLSEVPKESFQVSIKAKQFIYKNALKAVVKKTSFKTDEIVVSLAAGDGLLSMNERDYATSIMAQMVLPDGGLKHHSPEELNFFLRDKQLGLSLSIKDRHTEVLATTRQKDFRFVLELIRAFLVEPGYDEQAIRKAQEKIRLFYQQRAHSMDDPLQHDFIKLISGNDQRVSFPDLKLLMDISQKDLLSWHQRYLLNQPLKIVVVGDVDEGVVKDDIASVFGSISNTMEPKKIPPTLSYKAGLNQVYTVDSPEQAARILIRYPLSFPKVFPNLALSLTRDIINEQVRRKMREKKNLIYSANVMLMDSNSPYLQDYLDILVTVKKEDGPKVLLEMLRVIDKLARAGIKKAALSKARPPLLAAIQQAMQTNGYWAHMIMNSIDAVDLMKWVDTLEPEINKVSLQDINKILSTYFNTKNASTALVNPLEK